MLFYLILVSTIIFIILIYLYILTDLIKDKYNKVLNTTTPIITTTSPYLDMLRVSENEIYC